MRLGNSSLLDNIIFQDMGGPFTSNLVVQGSFLSLFHIYIVHQLAFTH